MKSLKNKNQELESIVQMKELEESVFLKCLNALLNFFENRKSRT